MYFKFKSSVTILKNTRIKALVYMKFEYLHPHFVKLRLIF